MKVKMNIPAPQYLASTQELESASDLLTKLQDGTLQPHTLITYDGGGHYTVEISTGSTASPESTPASPPSQGHVRRSVQDLMRGDDAR